MNCFQKFISLIFETTALYFVLNYTPLWIAFKSLYLWYSKQLYGLSDLEKLRCELLSKVYIFDIRNNCISNLLVLFAVVNCFQKFISLIFETTLKWTIFSFGSLWIAFKSLYLWYSKQQQTLRLCNGNCCELLSKVYIFDIRNNSFKNRSGLRLLWIAFKSLYLWYSKQPLNQLWIPYSSCELLSKVYIFDIRNN